MPFGPLVTLILLIYVLFLGVIMTFWFLLSPRRKPDPEQPRQQETYEATEEQPYGGRAYASSNDTMRGANASRAVRTQNNAKNTAKTTENIEARGRGRPNVPEREDVRENVRSYESDTRANTQARRGRREVEPKGSEARDREARDRDQTRPTPKRKNDAFEDFIRSKNDDFDF